ncbi:hypothetical protein BYT27DRAFT_7119810 [Phlegmacium glaucopus]|nr:hypothetical protein BYT27DRAFT_7119810 [Phlegmacium glaucopus]
MNQKSTIQSTPDTSKTLTVPEGYVLVIGNNDQQYIVPHFMIPATHQAFEAYQKRLDLHVSTASGGITHLAWCMLMLAHLAVVASSLEFHRRADPTLTERESLGLHAKIKALQERLGISYKGASHRLYMAKVEKVKAKQDTCKAFSSLKMQTERAVKTFNDMVAKLTGQDRSVGT